MFVQTKIQLGSMIVIAFSLFDICPEIKKIQMITGPNIGKLIALMIVSITISCLPILDSTIVKYTTNKTYKIIEITPTTIIHVDGAILCASTSQTATFNSSSSFDSFVLVISGSIFLWRANK